MKNLIKDENTIVCYCEDVSEQLEYNDELIIIEATITDYLEDYKDWLEQNKIPIEKDFRCELFQEVNNKDEIVSILQESNHDSLKWINNQSSMRVFKPSEYLIRNVLPAYIEKIYDVLIGDVHVLFMEIPKIKAEEFITYV